MSRTGASPLTSSGRCPSGPARRVPGRNANAPPGCRRLITALTASGRSTAPAVGRGPAPQGRPPDGGHTRVALRSTRAARPGGHRLFVILDNLSANKTPTIGAWAQRANVELCFTPVLARVPRCGTPAARSGWMPRSPEPEALLPGSCAFLGRGACFFLLGPAGGQMVSDQLGGHQQDDEPGRDQPKELGGFRGHSDDYGEVASSRCADVGGGAGLSPSSSRVGRGSDHGQRAGDVDRVHHWGAHGGHGHKRRR